MTCVVALDHSPVTRSFSLLWPDEIRRSPGVPHVQRPERGDEQAGDVPPADVEGAVPVGGGGRNADEQRSDRRVFRRDEALPEPGRCAFPPLSFHSPLFAA